MSSLEKHSPGTLIARYRIVRLLGAGGMGAVYEALHIDLEKRVALKVLLTSVAQSPDARVRFLREARLTARLHHPHVVDVTDVGVEGDTPFLVMEYLEGESLAALLDREGPLPVARLADLLLPVLAAVGAAHEAGIVHRDLKPDNVFLARNHDDVVVPKVLDFGISKVVDRTDAPALTGTAALLGTPSYLSPEHAQGARDVDARSDQYALGVLLYEAATGRLPFAHETLYGLLIAIVSAPLAPPRSHRPDLPVAFETVVLRAMARVPTDRFPSVHDLGLALLPFASASAQAAWTAPFHARRETLLEPRPSAPPAPPATPSQRPEAHVATTLGVTARALDLRGVSPRRAPRSSALVVGALLTIGLLSAALLLPSRPTATTRAPTASASPTPQVPVLPLPTLAAAAREPIALASDAPDASTRPVSPTTAARLPVARVVRPRPSTSASVQRLGSALRFPVPAPSASPTDGTNQAPILE